MTNSQAEGMRFASVAKLIFSVKRMPPEFRDVERISMAFMVSALVIAGVTFIPRHQRVLGLGFVILSVWIGRICGLIWHYGLSQPNAVSSRVGASSQEITKLASIGVGIYSMVFSAVAVDSAYCFLVTRRSNYLAEALAAAALVTFPLGKGKAKIPLGLFDVLLSVVALLFMFFTWNLSFIILVLFTGLIAWSVLFQKSQLSSSENAKDMGARLQ